MAVTHQTAKTQFVSEGDIKYAYRRLGSSAGVPLLFLMHFGGTMDFWDPLLINTIAVHRPVILFDNAGVGQSTGSVSSTGKAMAQNIVSFLSLIKVSKVDVLGFSMGGIIAPLIPGNAPEGLVRKMIIAGAGLSAGEDTVSPTAEDTAEVGRLLGGQGAHYDNGFDKLFFYDSPTSQAAGKAWWVRMHERGPATSGEERSRFASTGYADGGAGIKAMQTVFANFGDIEKRADGTYDILPDLKTPILVAQGKKDFMIPTVNSFVLQQRLPNARLKLFPDSGHGFLYQFAEEFAEDVRHFLDDL